MQLSSPPRGSMAASSAAETMMTPTRPGPPVPGSSMQSPAAVMSTPLGAQVTVTSPSGGEVVPATPEEPPKARPPPAAKKELRCERFSARRSRLFLAPSPSSRPIAAIPSQLQTGRNGPLTDFPRPSPSSHPDRSPLHDPDAPGALVLCTAAEAATLASRDESDTPGIAVVVDPYLAKKLRPHQREGVRWMYRALHGLSPLSSDLARAPTNENASGCLLADDMGLGKSLQSLALVWTMLRQGPRGSPTARRALLVCPASLVGSWGAEVNKWLGGIRAQAALAEGGVREAAEAYERWARGPPPNTKSSFDRWEILVTSYETLRRLAPLAAAAAPELLVCDEAHRLRNAQQGSQTLASLRMVGAPKRVLLTGTPIQNNLDEYAAVMDFACPGLVGPISDFHRRFTAPVQRGGEPGASASEVAAAKEAARELATLTSGRVLRRESSINAAHLPAKTEMVVFCRPTETQRVLYEEGAKTVRDWTSGSSGGVRGTAAALCAIGLLRQLANSVDQAVRRAKTGKTAFKRSGGDCSRASKRARVEDDERNEDDDDDNSGVMSDGDGDDDDTNLKGGDGAAEGAEDLRATLAARVPSGYLGGVEGSGKLAALKAMLAKLAADTSADGERMVIVSGFSAALDIAGALCAELGLECDRLDGKVPPDARSALVRNFNAGRGGRIMLLSCVAGGAGLNLVGANRLVLFDTSWNPAHDHQAMARVWRDGQTRPVTIYRLLAAGTVEEKVFQRQLLKHAEARAAGVGGEGNGAFHMGGSHNDGGRFTRDELSELVAFSSAETPATLAAAEWEDTKAGVDDALLRAAVDAEDAAVTAVVRLAGDGGRAKAIAEAEDAAAARPRTVKPGPKRLAFSDLLSKAKNRAGK